MARVRILLCGTLTMLLEVHGGQSLQLDPQYADILFPYGGKFGSKLNHRQVRDTQPVKYKKVPHELHSVVTKSFGFDVRQFSVRLNPTDEHAISGHVAYIGDPVNTVSVLDSVGGGCRLNHTSTVEQTAEHSGCNIAINAGFYDTNTGQCHGGIVSDGNKIQDSGGIQNVHFGITKNGSLFTGYLSEDYDEDNDFQQLIGGVIWLVRNGSSFVNQSKRLECEDTQETANCSLVRDYTSKGTLQQFANIKSARIAIGHDSEGRVMFLQVNGKTGLYGVNLDVMADLLMRFGAINAINLDGGGSSTFVVNNTVTNVLADECVQKPFTCERSVTTVICARSKMEPKRPVTSETGSGRNWTYAIIFGLLASASIMCNVLLCIRHEKMKKYGRHGDLELRSIDDLDMI